MLEGDPQEQGIYLENRRNSPPAPKLGGQGANWRYKIKVTTRFFGG